MDNKKIGLFLKNLREMKKISQEKLAYDLYVDRSVISRIENGKIPSTDILYNYSKYFNVSVDEILSGELKTDKNKDKIQKVGLVIYEEKNKLSKIIKIILISFVLLLLAFFAYFFVTFFNSTKVYSIAIDSNEINIQNGLFIQTREKIYFQLNSVETKTKDNINSIEIYYLDNTTKRDILSTTKTSTIFFTDYYGYEEYINFSDINKIVNNMYISIILENHKIITTKLNFIKDYTNIKLFLTKEKSISKNAIENNTVQESDDYLIDKINKLMKSQKKYYEISLNKKMYKVYILDDLISISFDEEEFNINILSNYLFEHKTFKNKEIINEYVYDYTNMKCMSSKCNNYNDDINLFKKIIDKL